MGMPASTLIGHLSQAYTGRIMIVRISGALAVIGGLAWLAKVALMWANGGTATTGGVVGLLFLAGGMCLALAGGLRACWMIRGPGTKDVVPKAVR
jgi:hypothetical protein